MEGEDLGVAKAAERTPLVVGGAEAGGGVDEQRHAVALQAARQAERCTLAGGVPKVAHASTPATVSP